MPILLVGALAGAWLTHVWHSEVKRQALQEERLAKIHGDLMGLKREKD